MYIEFGFILAWIAATNSVVFRHKIFTRLTMLQFSCLSVSFSVLQKATRHHSKLLTTMDPSGISSKAERMNV